MKDLFSESFYNQLLDQVVNWGIKTIPALLLIVVVFILARWLTRILLKRFRAILLKNVTESTDPNKLEREKRVTTLMGIARGVIMITLWAIFLMILLQQLGLNVGPILAGAGIVGLAVGFGAQELVRDAISGFFLLFENRIRTGDVAIVNGTGGLVENINLRTITLRDLAGVVHTFQNGKINTLSNMTKEWSAMVFDIGVAYKENVDQVTELIRQVGADLQEDEAYKDSILEPIEIFGLDKFGDSAVVIKARIKTQPIKQWFVGREFNRRLKMIFDQHGIEIPFPHRTIYWGEAIAPLKLHAEQNGNS